MANDSQDPSPESKNKIELKIKLMRKVNSSRSNPIIPILEKVIIKSTMY